MESSDSDSDDDCTSAAAASLQNIGTIGASSEATAPSETAAEGDGGLSFKFNPSASSFVFNPTAPSFSFTPAAPTPAFTPASELAITRLPSVSEDQPEGLLANTSEAPIGGAQAADEYSYLPPPVHFTSATQAPDDNSWQQQPDWQQKADWQDQPEWQEEMNWQEGAYGANEEEADNWDNDEWNDDGGSYGNQQYGFEDYIDPSTGEYWMDGGSRSRLPQGMLTTNWDHTSHDKSHWHPSGIASASTSPYTQATLQGATLQPWSGKLFFPTKANKKDSVTKYDTSFLLQFQNSCTTKPEELPAYLLNSGPAANAKRDYNTPFKSKHRAAGSDRSTLVLDGMAQRSDLFNQQDLHVPRAPRPEGPNGPVRTYDSNFLLQFQNVSSLKELPGFVLPDLPFVIGGSKAVNGPAIPSLITPGRGGGGKRSGKKSGGPRGGTGPKIACRSKFPNSIFNDHPEQRSVGKHGPRSGIQSPWAKPPQPFLTGPVEPLQESQNRWVRPDKDTEDEMQRLHKQVLSVLNKLTPEKFERLLVQLLQIKMDTKASMTLVIGSIFDKAVGEPAYAEMYAELCRRLSESTPQVEQHGEVHTFKRMMLKKCYDNFMNEAEEEEPDQMDGEQKEEADERFTAAKKRMFGNVTLIGELFKKGLLTLNIIKICITLLLEESLEEPDYRDIEALCLLLSSVGLQLAEYIYTITPQITELSSDPRLPSRMRFMLQAVLELQSNQWNPRMEKTVTPKKLSELNPGHQLKRASSHDKFNSPKQNFRNTGTPVNFRNSGTPVNFRNSGTPVNFRGGLSGRPTPSRASPATPMQRSASDGNVSLGRSDASPFDPSLLASLKIKRKSSREILNTVHDMEEEGRDRGFSSWDAPPEGFLDQIPAELRLDNKITPTVSVSVEQPMPTTAAVLKSPAAVTPSPAIFEKKVTSILDEYLASSDEVEAAECVIELAATDELLSTLATIAVMRVCEKKDRDRSRVDILLKHLFTSKALNETQLAEGMRGLLDSIPDMEMDVPKYGQYVATTMAQLLSVKAIKPSMVRDIMGDIVGTYHGPKVFVTIIGSLVTCTDLNSAKQAYIEMGIEGFDLMPGDAVWGEEEIQALCDSAKCESDLKWLFAH